MIGPLPIDPPLFQAPMAGFTNYAYRQIVRRFGGLGLPVTEMISVRGFRQMAARGQTLPDRLWGVKDEPRPLAVQIWDNNPRAMAEVAARLVREFGVSVVDINFGCPVRDVSEKAQSGSYLLRYPDRVGTIVGRVAEACGSVPVTAKIRLGCSRDTINAVDVAQAVEQSGGAAITIHGRTADQGFGGSADWRQIARVKPHLKRIPLIGNGDIRTPQDVVEAFDRFGVDGVMIGRAGLSKPWLFRHAQLALAGLDVPAEPSLDEQRTLLLDHYRAVVERFGSTKGTILMRRYACSYAQGRHGARLFRTHASRAATEAEFRDVVDRYFPCEKR